MSTPATPVDVSLPSRSATVYSTGTTLTNATTATSDDEGLVAEDTSEVRTVPFDPRLNIPD